MQRSRTKSQQIESLVRQNTKLAKSLWYDELGPFNLSTLKKLTRESGLALVAGEILWLNGGWYVTSGGLLRIAKENHCHGIHADAISKLSDAANNRWIFKATVYKTPSSKGFVGYGDADPSNVSSLVHGAEMRVAETRAVNRALRKAYGIGLCSVEELGAFSSASKPAVNLASSTNRAGSHQANGSGKTQPRLRDQLCLLIRQFKLDPNLVKSYAADFCGTEVLSEASRESVESFIAHLSAEAKENRDGLNCKLNSFSQSVEAGS
jgi:hypothetical protein